MSIYSVSHSDTFSSVLFHCHTTLWPYSQGHTADGGPSKGLFELGQTDESRNEIPGRFSSRCCSPSRKRTEPLFLLARRPSLLPLHPLPSIFANGAQARRAAEAHAGWAGGQA